MYCAASNRQNQRTSASVAAQVVHGASGLLHQRNRVPTLPTTCDTPSTVSAARRFITKVRTLKTGEKVGGIPFERTSLTVPQRQNRPSVKIMRRVVSRPTLGIVLAKPPLFRAAPNEILTP